MQGNSKGAAAADHGAREFQPREIVKVDWKPEGQACLAEMVHGSETEGLSPFSERK